MNSPAAVSYLLEHCLNFRVSVTLEEAAEVLRNFRRYNDIPDTLPRLIDDLRAQIGPIAFGGNNPNNGHFHNLTVQIGNENSLVLYIVSNLFYRKSDNPLMHKSTLESLGEKYRADEVSVEVETHPMDSAMVSVRARLWWD